MVRELSTFRVDYSSVVNLKDKKTGEETGAQGAFGINENGKRVWRIIKGASPETMARIRQIPSKELSLKEAQSRFNKAYGPKDLKNFKSERGQKQSRTYDLNHADKIDTTVRYNPRRSDYPGVDDGDIIRQKNPANVARGRALAARNKVIKDAKDAAERRRNTAAAATEGNQLGGRRCAVNTKSGRCSLKGTENPELCTEDAKTKRCSKIRERVCAVNTVSGRCGLKGTENPEYCDLNEETQRCRKNSLGNENMVRNPANVERGRALGQSRRAAAAAVRPAVSTEGAGIRAARAAERRRNDAAAALLELQNSTN